jgi:hypothetical protein
MSLQQNTMAEGDSLLSPNASLQAGSYNSIEQDLEARQVIVTQREKKAWLWTSDSYAWSIAALLLLLLIFTALEYALLKLNLPPVSP